MVIGKRHVAIFFYMFICEILWRPTDAWLCRSPPPPYPSDLASHCCLCERFGIWKMLRWSHILNASTYLSSFLVKVYPFDSLKKNGKLVAPDNTIPLLNKLAFLSGQKQFSPARCGLRPPGCSSSSKGDI